MTPDAAISSASTTTCTLRHASHLHRTRIAFYLTPFYPPQRSYQSHYFVDQIVETLIDVD